MHPANNLRTSRNSAILQSSLSLESLENRRLLAADIPSLDGTGNNLAHTDWGSAGIDLLRKVAAAYADSISSPTGTDRPSARAISNAIASTDGELLSDRNLSAFVYAWGQFLDHDIDLTPSGGVESFNINVPLGDDSFDPFDTGTKVIPLSRSIFDATTGTSAANPRQQVNIITAFIDGSVVYGSDTTRAAALRTFVGGLLKTSNGNLLPLNTAGLANANDAHIFADNQLFLAGDVRANENIELTSLQTLFMREHNRIATNLAKQNPELTDQQLYDRARQIVIAEIQAITYNEFIPALLGTRLAPYRGYNPSVNPGISNEFSTAAFRLGHSMLGDDVEFLDNSGEEVADELPLAHAFFNPQVVKDLGIDSILKYLASDRAQEIDNGVVDGVRNFLFGPPGSGGLDLASLNIQRGRDHGLADYNTTRAAYGLRKVTDFSQITSNPELQQTLKDLYGSVDNVDLWVGGLAEDHVRGSSLGPTFQRILADQFTRLRDGDRFYYENALAGSPLLWQIQGTRLSDIIRRNTGTTNLQRNVFVFDVNVAGTVFNDFNRNGRRERFENGMSNVTINLLDDETGEVLESTTTRFNGNYSFETLDLGTYSIQVLATTGWTQTTLAKPLQITRAMNINNINYGLAFRATSPVFSLPVASTSADATISDPTLPTIAETLLV